VVDPEDPLPEVLEVDGVLTRLREGETLRPSGATEEREAAE